MTAILVPEADGIINKVRKSVILTCGIHHTMRNRLMVETGF